MIHPTDLLPELPSHDVDPARAEAIRRQAHRVLADRARRSSRPLPSRWSDYYHGFVEPMALIALGLTYVAWTVQDTVALLR